MKPLLLILTLLTGHRYAAGKGVHHTVAFADGYDQALNGGHDGDAKMPHEDDVADACPPLNSLLTDYEMPLVRDISATSSSANDDSSVLTSSSQDLDELSRTAPSDLLEHECDVAATSVESTATPTRESGVATATAPPPRLPYATTPSLLYIPLASVPASSSTSAAGADSTLAEAVAGAPMSDDADLQLGAAVGVEEEIIIVKVHCPGEPEFDVPVGVDRCLLAQHRFRLLACHGRC